MTAFLGGIDIGGTKIAAALIDPATPTTLAFRTKVATPRRQVMSTVLGIVQTLANEAELRGGHLALVGVGAPGVIDPDAGTVVSAGPTMPGWAGTEIARQIREAFALPVAVHNDVRVMGLGEATYGAGRRFDHVLFLSLGTGVGGAFVRSGHLAPSPHFTAGEIRGLIGRDPWGNATPVEDFASGPGIARCFLKETGLDLGLPEIMPRLVDGDPAARSLIHRAMTGLGEALAGLASAVDVDAIIVGGGVGTLGEPILSPLIQSFRQYALPPVNTIPIIQAELGTAAPLVGAAHLAASIHEGTLL